MSDEIEAENIKEAGTEKTKEMGAKSRAEMEKELKEKDTVDTSPTGSGAVQPKVEPELKVRSLRRRNNASSGMFHSTTAKSSMSLGPVPFSRRK